MEGMYVSVSCAEIPARVGYSVRHGTSDARWPYRVNKLNELSHVFHGNIHPRGPAWDLD